MQSQLHKSEQAASGSPWVYSLQVYSRQGCQENSFLLKDILSPPAHFIYSTAGWRRDLQTLPKCHYVIVPPCKSPPPGNERMWHRGKTAGRLDLTVPEFIILGFEVQVQCNGNSVYHWGWLGRNLDSAGEPTWGWAAQCQWTTLGLWQLQNWFFDSNTSSIVNFLFVCFVLAKLMFACKTLEVWQGTIEQTVMVNGQRALC